MVGAAIAVLAEGAPEFADEHALAGVHGRLADELEAHVRHLRFAAERERQLVGEGHGARTESRLARTQHRRQPVEKSRLEAVRALGGLAQFDGVLRLEVAPAEVLSTSERYESRLPVLVQLVDSVAERRMQAPFGSKRQDAFPRHRDIGARLVIEAARDGDEDVRRVVAASQENKKEAAVPCRGCGKQAAGERSEEKAGGIPEKGSFVHRAPAIGS